MVKALLDSSGRFYGLMYEDFTPVNGMTAIDIDDEFAEVVNHLWRVESGNWVQDAPPAPPELNAGEAIMTHS